MKLITNAPKPYIKPNNSLIQQQQSIVALNATTMPSQKLTDLQIPFYGIIHKKNGEIQKENKADKRSNFTDEDYNSAKKYLDEKLNDSNSWSFNRYGSIEVRTDSLDLERLNGIQKDIKVFEGLSMKDIAFLCNNLYAISTNRGCSSKCGHCIVDAVPQHFGENSDAISKMSWEDFSLLTDGFEELNSRLNNKTITENVREITPFTDADGIDLEMKDKAGNSYDFTDIADRVTNKMNKKILFDTSGWTPKNERLQKRAEKIVEYINNDDNREKFYQVNISLNPFNGINQRAIEYKNKGLDVSAEKMRNLYTDRMANALFTFTPIIDRTNFNILNRVLPDGNEYKDGYKKHDQWELNKEILKKLTKLYLNDYHTNQKFIKSQSQVFYMTEKYEEKIFKIFAKISPVGRAEKYFGDKDKSWIQEELHNNFIDTASNNLKDIDDQRFIDANGKVYVSNYHCTLPTEIQLNFENKNKETVPYAGITDELTITKEAIDNAYKPQIAHAKIY